MATPVRSVLPPGPEGTPLTRQGAGPAAVLVPLTSLVGREPELEEIARRLGAGGLLTLTGPPGVGKSRLAFEAASRLQVRVGARAAVVDLEWLPSERHVAVAVANALDQARGPCPERGADAGLLVVLDDCDRWLPACAEVVHSLLLSGVQVLATAREALRVPGEGVWRVPPLSVPAPGLGELPEVFTESEAVALFCERAAAVRRGFVPTPETAGAIAEICRRLDGVPLAIELAAGNLDAHSPEEVLARLESPFAVLTDGPRTAPPRQRSLWACLAWSYELLTATEQVLFERLAVFPDSFSDQAAATVCAPEGTTPGEVAETLRALVNKSLLEVENRSGATRYRLLGMICRFAEEKLAVVGEEATLRDRHVRWCVGLVESAGDSRTRRRWLTRLAPHRVDIGAALEWSLAAADAEAAAVLGAAEARSYHAEGRHREADATLERVLVLPTLPAAAGAPRLLAMAGEAAAARGEPSVALARLGQAASLADGHGDRTEAARARLALGSIHALASGERAPLHAEVALARHGDPSLAADALIASGWADVHAGDTPVAVDAFASALDQADVAGDEVATARARVGLGAARVVLGRYREGEGDLERGLKGGRQLGEPGAAAMALGWLGESARRQGGADLARRLFSEGLELARRAGHLHPMGLCLLGLGRLALDDGNTAAATDRFEAASAAAGRGSISPLLAPSLCGLAEVAPRRATARARWDEARRAAGEGGDRTGEAMALYGLGRLNQAQGELTTATRRFRDALALQANVGDPAAMAESIDALADVAVARGDHLAAARLIGAADSLRRAHGCARLSACRNQHVAIEEFARARLGHQAFAAAHHGTATLSPEDAVAYVAKHVGKRSPRPTTGWTALTDAEHTVAALVAEGHTNKDIARRLGIAASTVKNHLRNVYAKLDVQTRTGLAAELHRRGGR